MGATRGEFVDLPALAPVAAATSGGSIDDVLGPGRPVGGIEATTGLRPALKWPNDLLWQGRKLGGMLTELRTSGERLEYAVLGLGINVNVTAGE